MSTPSENPYDKIPYETKPFPKTHPNNLAALARLFGMMPPSLGECRVLELGCASGGNLLPMATQLPHASFVGLDLSGRQIADGQAIIAELGLANVELRQADIAEVSEGLGKFDYIIAHGVFSWIPNDVQEKLLEICSRNLAENGVAFISYNTYPGWRMRGMIRDAMVYHARQFAEVSQQVKQARALLDFLAQNVPSEGSPYGMLLKQELEELRKQGDWYLAHEHLEGVNEPIYFHQFIERASAHRLQYLADADFMMMPASNFPPNVAETLRLIAPDMIRIEQYMDFLRNRAFRQTLLVHANVRLNRNLDYRSVAGLYVEAQIRPLETGTDLHSSQLEKFQVPNGATLSTPNPITKAGMTLLGRAWPKGMYFEDLCRAARAHLEGVVPLSAAAAPPAADVQILGSDVLQSFAAGLVDLRVIPGPFVAEPGQYPRANALARLQARRGSMVASMRHEPLMLDEFNRQLVQRLDGEQDRNALIDAMERLVKARSLAVQQDGKPIVEPATVREMLTTAVGHNLVQLGRVGLLEQ